MIAGDPLVGRRRRELVAWRPHTTFVVVVEQKASVTTAPLEEDFSGLRNP